MLAEIALAWLGAVCIFLAGLLTGRRTVRSSSESLRLEVAREAALLGWNGALARWAPGINPEHEERQFEYWWSTHLAEARLRGRA